MSDLPDSYFVNGVELLQFRRQPNLGFLKAPGEVGVGVKKKRSKLVSGARKKRNELVRRDGKYCHYCPDELIFPEKNIDDSRPNVASIEHIYPASLGGSNSMDNLVLACRRCNNGFGNQLNKCSCSFCSNAVRNKGFNESLI